MYEKLGDILAGLRGDTPKAKWAASCSVSDEYIRRIERGEALPSKVLIDRMFLLNRTPRSQQEKIYATLAHHKSEAPQVVEYLELCAGGRSKEGATVDEDSLRQAVMEHLVKPGYCQEEHIEYVVYGILQGIRR